ncbi:PTS system sorbose subfamily transporter subunit IIB [Streptococcus uberis]|nr:PTS system sorbose subfamily transporter subunit IIB [Streptococcus uberis]
MITKNPIDMKKLLVDQRFVPGNIKEIIIGPANDRPGAIKLGNNQSITKDEAAAIEEIEALGYRVKFQLLPDVSIGYWSDFKNKFGY